MNLLLRWGLASLALLLVAHFVPGIDRTGSPWLVLGATLAIGLLNVLARPVLVVLRLVTYPLSCLTLGLWAFALTLFANTLIFYFVGTLEWGYRVETFWSAVLGALALSLLTAILTGLLGVRRARPASAR